MESNNALKYKGQNWKLKKGQTLQNLIPMSNNHYKNIISQGIFLYK